MASKPIEWHRECLANQKEHLKRVQGSAELASKAYEIAKLQYEYYAAQIARADRMKKIRLMRQGLARVASLWFASTC